MGIILRCAAVVMLPLLGVSSPGTSVRLSAAPRSTKSLAPSTVPRRALLFSAFSSLGASGSSCGASKDMVVQALELLKADSGKSDLADAVEHLKRAADMCSESGEAWYYRSLVEDKLGHKPQAVFAMSQAKRFGSEAYTEQINPFILAAPKNAEPLRPIKNRWALVIGVGAFTDSNIPVIRYAADDAKLIHDFLVDAEHGAGFKPDNVRLITNDQATLRAVKENLNWLARNAKPDDLAVVYLASHGTARNVDNAMANYIATHDTEFGSESQRQKPEEVTQSDTLYATALPMAELATDVASRFQARRTAIFIDTCSSGGAIAPKSNLLAPGVASASVSKTALSQMSQGVGRLILAASQTEQQSYESQEFRHGYFTYYLVQALRDHADMPLSQIFALVQKQVSAGVDADRGLALQGYHQTPVMSRSDDNADFALGSTANDVANLNEGKVCRRNAPCRQTGFSKGPIDEKYTK